MKPVETFIFDLDGTLYEDERVYDRYTFELAQFLPPEKRERHLSDWQAVKEGLGAARVGLGYDEARDLLFTFDGGRIRAYFDWDGRQVTPHTIRPVTVNSELEKNSGPPIETPILSPERLNVGDWWGLADVLAAHHGVPRHNRSAAFLATRAFMDSDSFQLEPEPWLHELLANLASRGKRLVVMSNSPADTVAKVVGKLDIGQYFDLIMPAAEKPDGILRFLEGNGAPERVLSIGDNFVNDIEPAIRAGANTLYVDRHNTGLGADRPACCCVGTLSAIPDWLHDNIVSE